MTDAPKGHINKSEKDGNLGIWTIALASTSHDHVGFKILARFLNLSLIDFSLD